MLSFLVSHYKKHKTSLLALSGVATVAFGFLWNFDLQKLTPSGTLSAETLWEIRILMTPVLASLYLLSLLITILYHYKKDIEDYEAKLNPTPTFYEVNHEFINPSANVKKETIESTTLAPKPTLRSFPGPKIPDKTSEDFDAALARLKKLSEPSEPASASSEPGPDDYHVKRRSFFHSDNDRPKRR
jgi:hypothetical protein